MSTASQALYPLQPRYTLSQLLLIFATIRCASRYMAVKFVLQQRSILPMLAHDRSECMLGDLLVILALLVMSFYLQNQLSPFILLGGLLIIASACIIFQGCNKNNLFRREDRMRLC